MRLIRAIACVVLTGGCQQATPEPLQRCIDRFTQTADGLPATPPPTVAIYSYDVTRMSVDRREALMRAGGDAGPVHITHSTGDATNAETRFLREPVGPGRHFLMGERSLYRVRQVASGDADAVIAEGCGAIRDGARLVKIDMLVGPAA